jgi:arginyl-tRNA synthetase
LYVVARINSLLKKTVELKTKKKSTSALCQPEEKKLLLLLAEYDEVIQKALAQYNPSTITRYCFDLAQAFNEFYHKHLILTAESEELIEARLLLCESVKLILTDALGLLTIGTVEEM